MSIDYGLVSSNGIECKVNTSSLNEELGQIDYVFSDKTGTLTRNEMRFKHLVIGDRIYGENTGYSGEVPEVKNVEFSDPKAWELIGQNGQNEESYDFIETVRFLALCHTIIVEKNGDYSASSPDELAFVNFSKLLGCEFKGIDDDNKMTLIDQGKDRNFKLLEIFEFSSERKRMSAILEDEQGNITLYTKGADSIIAPRLSADSQTKLKSTTANLDKFADIGLRTLLLAKKEVSKEEYQQFKQEYEVDYFYVEC